MGIGFANTIDDLPPALLVPAGELNKEQKAFLNYYLQCGTIKGAEKLSKVHHLYHYQWLDDDPQYSSAFARIKSILVDHEIDAIKQRGLGYQQELSYKGQKTGDTITAYSDNIALAYIKANRPEWRDGNAATSAAPVSIAITYPSPQSGGNDLGKLGNATPAPKKIT